VAKLDGAWLSEIYTERLIFKNLSMSVLSKTKKFLKIILVINFLHLEKIK